MYKINQNEMDTSFRVPSSIVDRHIRLANEHQLKVLLWIMRNSPDNPDIDKMCKALKISRDDAEDYLQYWVLTGVLLCSDSGEEAKLPSPAPEAKEAPAPAAKPVQPASFAAPEKTYSKPSSAEITARLAEEPEVGILFREAQARLGKTIGYEMQCTLLMMYDYDGLPIEVIFMLLDYCVSVGKTSCAYLAKVSSDWGNQEIDSIDKADEKIKALNTVDRLWSELAEIFGITHPRPTAAQSAYISKWCVTYKMSTAMIAEAYEEMANHTNKMSFPYMDKVIENWHSEGIETPESLAAHRAAAADVKKESEAKKNIDKSSGKGKASYSIEQFEKDAMDDIHYERKKKKK